LIPFAVVGLLFLPTAAALPVVSCILLYAAYLSYAHPSYWVVYYLETFPVAAFLTANGLGRVFAFSTSNKFIRFISGHESNRTIPARGATLLVTASILLLAIASAAKLRRENASSLENRFRQTVARLDRKPSVAFVRFPTDASLFLVTNHARLDRSRTWVVFDRGPLNQTLKELAGDRDAYSIDIPTLRVTPITLGQP
jgi:hypothetical protein